MDLVEPLLVAVQIRVLLEIENRLAPFLKEFDKVLFLTRLDVKISEAN